MPFLAIFVEEAASRTDPKGTSFRSRRLSGNKSGLGSLPTTFPDENIFETMFCNSGLRSANLYERVAALLSAIYCSTVVPDIPVFWHALYSALYGCMLRTVQYTTVACCYMSLLSVLLVVFHSSAVLPCVHYVCCQDNVIASSID